MTPRGHLLGARALAALAAGFVSTLAFHQGTLALFHAAGLTARAPYAMEPTWPFHVPAVISLAVWGGLWAVLLSRVIDRHRARIGYWTGWIALGAILPSIVALFVVLPLKGAPVAGILSPGLVTAALLLNGAWGLGVALILRSLDRLRRPRDSTATA